MDIGLGGASSKAPAAMASAWAGVSAFAIGLRGSSTNVGRSNESPGIWDLGLLVGPAFHNDIASVVIAAGVDRIGGVDTGAPAQTVVPSQTGIATHAAAAFIFNAHVGLGVSYTGARGGKNQFTTVTVALRLGRLR